MGQRLGPRGQRATREEVTELRREVQASAPGVGPLERHLNELKFLGPDVAGIDLLDFECLIDTNGAFVAAPSKESTPGGFYAELVEIRGCMEKPETTPEAASALSFNVRDVERSGNLFTTDIKMGHLVSQAKGGSNIPLKFERGLYVFDPGSRIEVKFIVDTRATYGFAALVSTNKKFNILLVLNLYAM